MGFELTMGSVKYLDTGSLADVGEGVGNRSQFGRELFVGKSRYNHFTVYKMQVGN